MTGMRPDRVLLALALGATFAAPALRSSQAPAQPRDGGAQAPDAAASAPGAVRVGSLPTWDALAEGDVLVRLAPDAAALTGHDPTDLSVRWTVALPALERGDDAQLSELEPGLLLVHTGASLLSVDASTGAVRARHAAGLRNTNGGHVFLWRQGDACGLNTQCSFQPLDCATLAPFGAPWRSEEVHRYRELGGPHDTQCLLRAEVLGATRDTALFVAAGARGHRDPALVAYDRRTGAERYRVPGCALCDPTARGSSPDGSVCWLGEREEDSLRVRAFRCATGATLWRYSTPRGRVAAEVWASGWVDAPSPGVLLSLRGSAVLLDARTGAARWTRPLAPDALGLVQGARSVALASPSSRDAARSLVLLEGSSGAVQRSQPVPAGYSLRLDASGAPAVVPLSSDHYTTGGAQVRAPASAPRFEVLRAGGQRPATVRLVGSAQPLWQMPSDGWWVGEFERGPLRFGAVFSWRPEGPGELVVFRAGP